MRLQGLGGFLDRVPHPLVARTFGAAIVGQALTNREHILSIYALTMHPATIEQWHAELDRLITRVDATPLETARSDHYHWWDEFWNRSWIYITSKASEEDATNAFHVTQGYILQRFMNACAGRGTQPIKFNGSLFTVGKPDDPDFRRWGGPGFWFMNMRLIYWPMLAAGDFDLMQPWFAMYREMLSLQRHRTQTYFGHGGAHFPETIMFWGAEVSGHYGWTPFEQRKSPEAECAYVTYHWQGGIEMTLMMWAYFDYTGDEAFARSTLLPMADAVSEFYDLHYPTDENGKMRIEPAESLETWHDATNPTPELAGLRYTLDKLLSLPEHLTTAELRHRWRRMLLEVPQLPTGEKDGKRVVLPAYRFEKKKNTENPELYCIFPYRIFGANKPELQLARDTFAVRLHPSHDCWSQDDIQMALLGLAEQAKDFVTRRASPASSSDSRFPGFWNMFHDWIPDMDHGGVLQLALQFMLMQAEGDRIDLLPAWPTGWDADFKLHAPRSTVVEGKVCDGRIVDLRMTPESRRANVTVHSANVD
jgi:hypothetical protein